MKILYAALRYDYGRPEQGPSFEHQTFYDTLRRLGHEIVYFELDTVMQEHDRAWLNRRLWELAKAEDPDLLFCVLFGEELDKDVMRRISTELRTVTVNWFCDDHWRFHGFSRLWTPCFNWVVTTAAADVAPYEDYGLHNVIRSQWACNHFTFRRLEDRQLHHDVTFAGMAHGDRGGVIDAVRRAGIDVQTWGSGWPAGRLSVEEMVRVFNESRVNINLSHSSIPAEKVKATAVLPASAITQHARRAARRIPAVGRASGVVRAVRHRLHAAPPQAAPSVRYVKQLKGRTFEVPGCGGFLLTQNAPELERYFELGREAVAFRDVDELVEKLRHYLAHEDERAAVAEAGYARVLRDHTYERRFAEIFSRIGLTP